MSNSTHAIALYLHFENKKTGHPSDGRSFAVIGSLSHQTIVDHLDNKDLYATFTYDECRDRRLRKKF